MFCSDGLTTTGSGQMMRAAVTSGGRRLPGLFPSFLVKCQYMSLLSMQYITVTTTPKQNALSKPKAQKLIKIAFYANTNRA